MTHTEFLNAFEECTIPNTEFNHRAHIRMAWLYLRRFGYEVGSVRIKEGIQRFAAAKNQNTLYHETITQFWIHLVQHAIESFPGISDFDSFVDRLPCLQNAKSIYEHYSRDLLMSPHSKNLRCDPDLLSLPVLSLK